MSLNCLTCSQMIRRTDSFSEFFTEEEYREVCKEVDRSWPKNVLLLSLSSPPSSQPLSPSPPPSQLRLPKGGAVAKINADHRRVQSTGNVPYPSSSEPRLVRSCGMRRNWSFEDLGENQDKRVSCH